MNCRYKTAVKSIVVVEMFLKKRENCFNLLEVFSTCKLGKIMFIRFRLIINILQGHLLSHGHAS